MGLQPIHRTASLRRSVVTAQTQDYHLRPNDDDDDDDVRKES